MLLRLQPRIKHIKRHLITLRRPRNRNKTLIAIILRFINLNHRSTQLTNLIDLGSALADDSTDHVVRDVDLLRQWLPWNNTLHRLNRWSCMASSGWTSVTTGHLWLLWSDAGVGCCLWAPVCDWRSGALLWDWCSSGLGSIWCLVWCWSAAGAWVVLLHVAGVTVAATCGLWDVWNNLHATWDNASWATLAGSICRCGWTTESGSELVHEGGSDVVCGDVDGVCYTEDNEGSLAGKWQVHVGGVELGAGLLLDLLDAGSSLADDGADEDGWDEKAEWVCSGLSGGCLLEGLAVQCANDQTECLRVC